MSYWMANLPYLCQQLVSNPRLRALYHFAKVRVQTLCKCDIIVACVAPTHCGAWRNSYSCPTDPACKATQYGMESRSQLMPQSK
jgi:hypothetical protein